MIADPMDTIYAYLERLSQRYQTGIAREHAYRGDLEQLLRGLLPDVEVINEPQEVADCGNPDFVIIRKDVPIGFIEAKDIGKDLDARQFREQFDRYRKALPNLIITNYLDFQFYEDGEQTLKVSLGTADGGITPLPENFETFVRAVKAFRDYTTDTIKSPSQLAQMMADRARLLESIIAAALESDDNNQQDTELKAQHRIFSDLLMHDMTPRQFADIYAQTLAYGLFAARLHDDSLEDFSRQEAAELIPKSNPFLRKFFGYIAGPDIDPRILPVMDHLVTIFRYTNVRELLKNFGKSTARNDPIIHFYETFLAAYDSKLRKTRGVYYTPEPVVDFIVRGVNQLLKDRFHLPDGLADTSKITITVDTQVRDGRTASGYKQGEVEVHKVQILDPATGTGTFLAQIIKHLHEDVFQAMTGIWPGYVEQDLIPRLHGFEFLMAPYAMAHLKLDLLLQQTGYRASNSGNPPRLNVYLTNSLEPYHPDTGTLFAQWLSRESEEANRIKRETPVMVVLGNPPYSGHSANKGKWIASLLDDYKQEPGGGRLKERNAKWLNDDYVKFIRYGQHYVEKNGEGILAYINNHSFLDNPTFRGMRWHLLKTFDEIFIIDLHGNSKKKETAPDGGKDENVFDIQQGVSINIFVKIGQKNEDAPATVWHCDLYGKRQGKYDWLWQHDLKNTDWVKLQPAAPMYFFIPRDVEKEAEYQKGFSVTDLLPIHSNGMFTARDNFTIHESAKNVHKIIHDFVSLDVEVARQKYQLRKDVQDWKVAWAQQDLRKSGLKKDKIVPIAYRPFDIRYTYFTGKPKGFHCRPRGKFMRHFLAGKNMALVIGRQGQAVGGMEWNLAYVTQNISDLNIFYRGGALVFPLCLYPDNTSPCIPNLNPEIAQTLAARTGLPWQPEARDANALTPLGILDYIYAVLHSHEYRQRYAEFLKSDFPRIPWPKDGKTFRQLASLGDRLRQAHLLQGQEVDNFITTYPRPGDNQVTRGGGKNDYEITDARAQTGRAWINDEQYFEGIPKSVWDFYIGGYQPARKWLKDRKGKTLDYDAIRHYQRIIKALVITEKLMSSIDGIDFLP